MLCLLCQEPDSISHTFLNCHWSKQFFSEVLKRSNKETGTSFSPSPLEILFGLEPKNYPQGVNKSLKKSSFTLTFAKYYLYTQNYLIKKEINMKELIRKLTSKFQIEKLLRMRLLYGLPPHHCPPLNQYRRCYDMR